MRTIGIMANQSKPRANEVTAALIQMLDKHGVSVVVDEDTAQSMNRPELGCPLAEFPSHVDMLFILGGDGTLLGAARRFACHDIPMLGINIGHLGFLSEAEPEDLETAVRRVILGEYELERRLMIQTSVWRGGKRVHESVGLNDAGIGKGSFARMIQVKVWVDDECWDAFAGDGLIVSTPTGSTAYSLSSGGPVVVPHMKAMVLTPICAHKLVARPCVIDASQRVRVDVSATHKDMGLTVDGQVGFALQNGDQVIIERAECDTVLVRLQKRGFFSILQSKLRGD